MFTAPYGLEVEDTKELWLALAAADVVAAAMAMADYQARVTLSQERGE
jgi:hypothetical protein